MAPTSASSPLSPIAAAQRAAALVNHFDPRTILPAGLAGEERRAALSQLAEDSEEVRQGDRVFWQLKPEARVRILTNLNATGQFSTPAFAHLAKALGSAADQFGKFLREALAGRPPKAASLDTAALSDLNTALEFASAVGVASADPTSARGELARRAATDALNLVAPKELLGRRTETAVLAAFVKTGIVPPPYATGAVSLPPVLVVTGVGGSGKSALIARFALDRRGRDWKGAPVVVLDFDRAVLAGADPVDLTLEFTRQIGWTRPAHAAVLSEIRTALRQRASGLSTTETDNLSRRYEHRASANTAAFDSISSLVAGTELARQPLLIILDTFEEVLNQGPFILNHLFRWLHALVDEAGFEKLRVIMSGRAEPTDVSREFADGTAGRLPIEDLDLEASLGLLARQGFPDRMLGKRLFGAFGGNPLVLRMLADYLAKKGRAAARTFLTTETERGEFRGEFAQRWLYSRVLQRIDDKELRKLAFPGLVLRRVTPDLVHAVLAGPCELGQIEQPAADALFGRLAAQVWLVEREATDPVSNEVLAVRHRRDVRRLMMIGIGNASGTEEDEAREASHTPHQRDEARKVAAIHRGARSYYAAGRDPRLGPAEQRREWMYHALMLNDLDALDEQDAADTVRALGEDIQFLPLAARARAKRLIGRSLDRREQSALTGAQRVALERERFGAAVASGATATAFSEASIAPQRRDKAPARTRSTSAPDVASRDRRSRTKKGDNKARILPPALWIQAEFAACRFDAVADLLPDVIRELDNNFSGGSDWDPRPWKGDYAEHAIWLVVLAQLGRSAIVPAERVTPMLSWLSDRPPLEGSARSGDIGSLLGGAAWILAVNSTDEMNRRAEVALLKLFREHHKESDRPDLPEVKSLIDVRIVTLMASRAPWVFDGSKTMIARGGYLSFFAEPFLQRVRDRPSKSQGRSPLGVEITETLRRTMSSVLKTETTRLSSADDVAQAIGNLRFQFDLPETDRGELVAMLRGVTSELYGPARTCFAEAITTSAARRTLVEAVWDDLPIRPDRLEPKEFARLAEADPHRWFTKLIEFVNCCGQLETLLTAAQAIAPSHTELRQLVRLFDRLDAALLNRPAEKDW